MKNLRFWGRVLRYCPVSIIMAALLFPLLYTAPPLMLAAIIAIISLTAWLGYKKQVDSIWFIPATQMLLTVCACIILLILDIFGVRLSGGFISIGVGFLIPIAALYGLCWIVPSAVISAIYSSVVKYKAKSSREC